jgi:hypothetical protein
VLRLTWILAAWIALAGLGARVGHMALVSHELCPAHGQIAHGAGEGASAHAHGGGIAPELAIATGEDDDHDHCNAVTTAAFACAATTVTPLTLQALPPPAPLRNRAAVVARAWLLAPKTSPPSARS